MAEIHVAACGPKGGEAPGRGDWAACAPYLTPFDKRPHTATISQGYAKTTLERMRVMGVVCALEALRGPSEANLWVDEATNRALTQGHSDIDTDLKERLDQQLRSHRIDLSLVTGDYELATNAKDAARKAAEAPEEELEDDLVDLRPVSGKTLDTRGIRQGVRMKLERQQLMNETPHGTICGHRWANGVSLGMHKSDATASLEYDRDLDAIVLLVNDENIERQGIEVIHTDRDWTPPKARAGAPMA